MTTQARLRRLAVERNRLDAARARTDTRDWAKARRERTRHLIELGGLVQKAGLVELTDDDRATLLGAFLELATQLRNGDDQDTMPADLVARWRRHGLRAFEADKETTAAQDKLDREVSMQRGRSATRKAEHMLPPSLLNKSL